MARWPEKLSAERIVEIMLNSSIPDALYTIPFTEEGTEKVESEADAKGVRNGIRVTLGNNQSFVLRVEIVREPPIESAEKAAEALRRLVHTINDTGGATVDRKGYTVPVVDQEWTDLGAAYEAACAALGMKPEIDDAAFEGEENEVPNGEE